MSHLNSDGLSVLDALYQKHRSRLEPLPDALRALQKLTDEFEQLTGATVAPWELWEAIMRRRVLAVPAEKA